MNIIKLSLFFLLSLAFTPSSFAEDEFLKVEEAFIIDVVPGDPGHVRVHFEIADHHYMYRDRFKFKAGDENTTVGQPTFPPAEEKYDEAFGKTMFIYHDSLDLQVPVSTTAEKANISIRWQGCAEAGLCYPPVTKKFEVAVVPGDGSALTTAAASEDGAGTSEGSEDGAVDADEEGGDLFSRLILGNKFIMFLGFFIFGILLALTPCVLPMVPILSTIITGQSDLSTKKAFSLSLVYVLFMALTFALAGAAVGAAGATAMQSAPVLGTFSTILVLLSLSMFGLYKLELPSGFQNKLTAFSNKQEGGNYVGVAIMGALSALIVGPCVTAPAAAALVFIADTGNLVVGFFALLGLGLGMGVPILAFGTAAGGLVPKAGMWMIRVQHIFGFIILGMAIYIIDRVMNDTLVLFLSGGLMVAFGVYCNPFDHNSDKEPGWHTTFKALGLVSLIWGVLCIYGAAQGGVSLMQPIKSSSVLVSGGAAAQAEKLKFDYVKNTDELDAALAKAKSEGKPVMLDFTADWCTYCKAYETKILPSPDVAVYLKEMVLLKVDVTELNDDLDAIKRRYKVAAPPTFVFFDANGKELKAAKIVGSKKHKEFLDNLKANVLKI